MKKITLGRPKKFFVWFLVGGCIFCRPYSEAGSEGQLLGVTYYSATICFPLRFDVQDRLQSMYYSFIILDSKRQLWPRETRCKICHFLGDFSFNLVYFWKVLDYYDHGNHMYNHGDRVSITNYTPSPRKRRTKFPVHVVFGQGIRYDGICDIREYDVCVFCPGRFEQMGYIIAAEWASIPGLTAYQYGLWI